MDLSLHKKQLAFLIIGAFFSVAPYWATHIQHVWGRTLFGTPDAFVSLGVTLLIALLGSYLLPNLLVSNRTGTSSSCRSRTKALGFGVGLLSLVSLVYVLYLVNQHILHSFLSSADEHSCYFLAECLRRGKLFVETPPMADFFKVVHVGMRDGKWFSVYPPGWPLIWSLGMNLNIVDWLNPALSALSVFFFYLVGKNLFGRGAALLGLAFMIPTPFFMFTSASYFSHSTCLLCISVFLYAFLKWRDGYVAGRDPIGWASLCAFAVGYGLMTRYLTMAAVAGPFLLYHYLPIFFGWRGWGQATLWKIKLPIFFISFKRPRLRKSDWVVIGIIAAFMILILYQNYLVTGKAFRAPNKHDKSWERLGFRKDYTPVDGFFYFIARFFYLADWFPPAMIALYLVSLFQGGQAFKGDGLPQEVKGTVPTRLLFRWTFFFIASAYFFYYSWGGNQWGPRYYFEGLPFLCLSAAVFVVGQWQEGSLARRKFFFGFLVVTAISGAAIFVRQADYVEESSRQRKALYELADHVIKKPAIVFIHGFLGDRLVLAEDDAVRNSPFLDTRILYAHDLGERTKELMAAYPGRVAYRGNYDRVLKQAELEPLLT